VPSGHYENHFDQQSGVWDLSGVYNETKNDASFNFTIAQDNKGKISGQGTVTGSEEGIDVELDSTISGSIKSIGEVTRAVLNELPRGKPRGIVFCSGPSFRA
jgi:hypothetical protein